ncbi:MAG: M20/M25/M40 family metallo-hydrolase [Acidimicrobiales bacterium]
MPHPQTRPDFEPTRFWEDDAVPTLSAYTTVPCLSPAFDADWERAGHLADAAGLLADWGRARRVEGLTVDVVAPPGRTPLLLAQAPATEGAAGTVLVYGHLDKQPPLGEWRDGLGAFTPVRRGDRLYGRGTADDGYAFFAALGALEALDAKRTPRPRVVVLVEASEESGSPDLPEHLDAQAPLLGVPDLVVCLDSGCLSYDRLWLTSSLRGNLVAAVTVQVLTEGVHSGSAGGVVPTSFRLLRRLLDRLEDPSTGEVRLEALHADVPDGVTDGAADVGWRAADVYPIVPGLELAGDSEPDRLVRRSWRPSLTVTGIDGVPPVRDGGNVLRPSTTAKLSLRLPPTVDAQRAAAALTRALEDDPPDGARVTLSMEAPAMGWAAPPFEPWVTDAFERTSMQVFGKPPGTLGEGGTIPFLAMLGERYPGVPLVATGVLGPGSNAHGPNEFLHLPMAAAVTTATAELLAATATHLGSPG